MTQARAIMLAARLDRGGVADHIQLLSQELSSLGFPASAATPVTLAGSAEWIGLHFVCYAWARHGILRRPDIARLRALCAGRRVAIYLHELWIGESTAEPVKNRIVGLLQKRGVKRLLRTLEPAAIFTSTPAYQSMLTAEKIAAAILPLPGNLPLAAEQDMRAARAWLDGQTMPPRHEVSLAAVFGTIHPEWKPLEALREWTQACRAHGQKPVLLTIGRHGPAGNVNLARLKSKVEALRVISAGEHPPEIVAGLLASCDFGLATSPWALIGKSGSAAAFLEAGLPVVVTRNDWHWRRGATPAPRPHPQLHLWQAGDVSLWSGQRLKRTAPASRLRESALAWKQVFDRGGRA